MSDKPNKPVEFEFGDSENLFHAAFESSAIGIGILSIEGDILAVNNAVCQMSGYTEEELKRRNDSQNVYPPDAQVGMDLFAEMIAGKRPHYSIERRYLRKNGEVFWTRLTLSLVRDAQGNPAYLVGQIEDIDEQKRTLAELKESEARFRAMFESSAMGVVVLDAATLCVRINERARDMLGYQTNEIQLNAIEDLVRENYRQRELPLFNELLEGRRNTYHAERVYEYPDRPTVWAKATFSVVRDASGQLRFIVIMLEDITEQKKTQQTLAESESRFRAIYENAAIGISLIGLDGRPLAVNPVLVQLSGRSEAELMELGGQNITFEEDLDVGRAEFGEILAGRRDSYQVEKRYVHKDGRIQWMRQSVSAVRDSQGKTQYMVVIAEDIDERKRAVEELRESEARFKAMFDNSAVGVSLMSLDRRILQINPTVTQITGYSAEEMVVINPTDLVVEEDRSIDRELFQELVKGQRDQYLIEKRYIRKDGSIFWGRINFALVRDAQQNPQYIVGMIEDITEEKRGEERLVAQEAAYRRLLEQRIAERTEELNQANERLREKAAQDAVIAERTRLARDLHDAVTQALFSTTLIADVLPSIWEMNPDEGKRRLEEVRQLTRGALAEMRTLLVELRPNALVEVPLPSLLRQLTEAMISRSRINIQFSADGDETGERKLPADVQISLYRIAQEALNNVVKHANASQAVVTLRVGESVRMTVADNGSGFDPSTITGDHLGLKIMRERADVIGARLLVYSEPGEGTQISVVWSEG
jgi:PAS domain S-box-containing protein